MARGDHWSKIYTMFRKQYPRLKKDAIGYKPQYHDSIVVFMKDGHWIEFDRNWRRAKWIK
jgi:hypothetical protein